MIRLGDDLAANSFDDRIDRVSVARKRLIEARRDHLGPVARRDARLTIARFAQIARDHLGERATHGEIGVRLNGVENRGPLEARGTRSRFGHVAAPSGRSTTRIDRVRSSARYA